MCYLPNIKEVGSYEVSLARNACLSCEYHKRKRCVEQKKLKHIPKHSPIRAKPKDVPMVNDGHLLGGSGKWQTDFITARDEKNKFKIIRKRYLRMRKIK